MIIHTFVALPGVELAVGVEARLQIAKLSSYRARRMAP